MRAQEVKGLIEAYSRVYVEPQELTEEQVWEEVETWVNSLLEEGYDLSEYTWEEMYEAYIEELFGTSPGERKLAQEREARINQQQQKVKDEKSKEASGARKALQGGKVVSVASNLGGLRSGTTVKMDSAATRAGGKTVLRATTQQGADAPEKSIRLGGSSYDRLTTKDGVKYIERKTATPKPAPRPAATAASPRPAATRPAATAAAPKPAATSTAKPAATAAAKPAAPKPATGMLGKTSYEIRTPTSSELKAAQAARASGASPEKALQAAKSAGSTLSQTVAAASKPTAFNPSSSSSSTAAAKPTAPSLQQSIRNRRLNMDLDVFDLVKGYLLDEGYAETEESAIVMMVNMSEGWRESILEVIGGQSGDGYIGHPKLGIKNPMSPPKKGVTSAPKNTGLAGRLGNRAAQMDDAMKQLNQSHEIEGEQLDEISQKLATRAYAQSATGEFEGHDDASDIKRTDNLRKHIKRKFGDKAAEDADRHADSETFGRKDPRTGKRQGHAKPRIEKNRTYRTTKAGKMHGQDQAKLKSDLKYNRSSRNEEYMDEAQAANRDPDKYEREQSKKTAPVRGERTPMPPRGDKRREDFEKWYAANVR